MSLILVILVCDDVKVESEKTIALCYKLQEKFHQNLEKREEVFKLGKCVEANFVEITAANFYVFDKTFIIKIIGGFATYAIIIIQFYTSFN